MDKADIGAIGERLVLVELLKRDVEVAVPVVDRGLDLIAFATAPTPRAVPLQVKTTPGANFTVHRAWERVGGLVIVYVFDVATRPSFYLLTYGDAVSIAGRWTNLSTSVSWNDPKRGNHDWSSLTQEKRGELRPFADRWDLVTARLR